MHCIHNRVNGNGVDLEAMLALDGSGCYDARCTSISFIHPATSEGDQAACASTLRARAIKALLKGNQQSQSLINF